MDLHPSRGGVLGWGTPSLTNPRVPGLLPHPETAGTDSSPSGTLALVFLSGGWNRKGNNVSLHTHKKRHLKMFALLNFVPPFIFSLLIPF